MLARGYSGVMPVVTDRQASPREWLSVMLYPLVFVVVLVLAVM